MQERRAVPRSKTYFGGSVAFNKNFSTLDCLVRNMSKDGAQITFANPAAILPDEFDLTVPRRDAFYRARVVWRSDAALGVAFVPVSPSTTVVLSSASKIRHLEVERERLKSRVAQLSELG